jgi:gliding motility-associated-like protein
MKQTRQYILLTALLWANVLPILGQCPTDLLFIKAPESICPNSKELVLRTSKAKENNAQYIWKMPSKDTVTTDSILVIKKPQPIHSGKYSVFTRIGTCSSTPVGALEVTILGLSTLTEPVKQIKLCGKTDTTISSNFKTVNGITGKWFAAEGVEIVQPESEKTTVKNLSVGGNLLIWTLSTDKCQNFAKDSFKINVEVAPRLVSQGIVMDARDAKLTVPLGTVSGSNIDLISEIEIKIDTVTKKIVGKITSDGKNLKYTRKPGLPYTDQFSLTVCNKRCSTLCSSPTNFSIDVKFTSQYPSITIPKLLSKFNPKGLIIDNVEEYMENELLVLDRWGGVVEKIPNYPKDKVWDGTKSGKPLPSGAYYIVFYANRDTKGRTDFKPVSSIIYIID